MATKKAKKVTKHKVRVRTAKGAESCAACGKEVEDKSATNCPGCGHALNVTAVDSKA